MIEAKVIADSVSAETGKRLTTLQVKFHRFILAEMNTHRVFSRSYSSSRAVPVAKLIRQVRDDPAMPVYWGKNVAGMQAKEQVANIEGMMYRWSTAARAAAYNAEYMMEMGLHKQIANRVLEPFVWVRGIITSTEWDNFFALRCHPDAQPEMQAIATAMRDAIAASTPVTLHLDEWHLPYITDEDWGEIGRHGDNHLELAGMISAARCCRVSYLRHDGTPAPIEEDLELCAKLVKSVPIHASPFEHQATPDIYLKEAKFGGSDVWDTPALHGNFVGWIQHRKLLEARQNFQTA